MSIDLAFIWTAFVKLLPALPNTILITTVSMVFGLLIGTLTAFARVHNVPVVSQLSAAYVSFIRGTPTLTHLLLVYFGLPLIVDQLAAHYHWSFTAIDIPMIGFAYIAFSITAGAYLSEVVRSGLLAVDKGQTEAGLSIGMNRLQVIRRIVLPQALATSVPNLGNAFIGLMHGSTLAFAVSVVDINAKAQIIASNNWKYLEAYIAAALLFWGLTICIEKLASVLEKRIQVYARGGVS
ncbi:amino acid ABC transporter permease [Cohnella abietis]|uniref:Cysteine ABC transporter permease n=1 Tax=Cohnella abietis TaxID=2507935 RepID=A0A3T1DBQ3_9BACL|nr:amino acid ABC transporter permease [Cohnella abietis]BBI35556.1 cysteine ABC transporter permease [Cohnella abietis]